MKTTITKLGSDKSMLGDKYLTFILGKQSYGIAILKVREIIRPTFITVVPQMPPYCCGVINLRGKIIPVMDLRLRFNVSASGDPQKICIIVVQTKFSDDRLHSIGLVVDEVEEVVAIGKHEIESTPNFGGSIQLDFVTGIANVKGQVKVLIEIEKVLGTEMETQLASVI
jgi:purine-binding chemotaxis protein CheW